MDNQYENFKELTREEYMGKDLVDEVDRRCSRCSGTHDVRVLTDHPYFGICKECRDKIDAMIPEDTSLPYGYGVEAGPDDACSCGSKEDLKATGFGGYRDPRWSFTCQKCIDQSQDEYERQQMESDFYFQDY